MLMKLLYVGLGGALGSLLRFAISLGVSSLGGKSFLATFIVNIVGSFLFGLGYGLKQDLSAYPFIFTGLLGGFTTFSTFSFDSVQFLMKGQVGLFCLYIFLTVGISLASFFVGYTLSLRVKFF